MRYFILMVLCLLASKGICGLEEDDCLEWEWEDVSGIAYSDSTTSTIPELSSTLSTPADSTYTANSEGHVAHNTDSDALDGYEFVAAQPSSSQLSNVQSKFDGFVYLDSTVEPTTAQSSLPYSSPAQPVKEPETLEFVDVSTESSPAATTYVTAPGLRVMPGQNADSLDGYEFVAAQPSSSQLNDAQSKFDGFVYLDSTVEPTTAHSPSSSQLSDVQSKFDGFFYLDSTVEPTTTHSPLPYSFPAQPVIEPEALEFVDVSTESSPAATAYVTAPGLQVMHDQNSDALDGYEFVAAQPSSQLSDVQSKFDGFVYLDSTVEPTTTHSPLPYSFPAQPVIEPEALDFVGVDVSTQSSPAATAYVTAPGLQVMPDQNADSLDGYEFVAAQPSSSQLSDVQSKFDGFVYLDSTVGPTAAQSPLPYSSPAQPVKEPEALDFVGVDVSTQSSPAATAYVTAAGLQRMPECAILLPADSLEGHEYIATVPSSNAYTDAPPPVMSYVDSVVESTTSYPSNSFVRSSQQPAITGYRNSAYNSVTPPPPIKPTTTVKPVTVPIFTPIFDGKYVSKVSGADSSFAVDKLKATEHVNDNFANAPVRPHYGIAEKVLPPESPVADGFLNTNHHRKKSYYRSKVAKQHVAYTPRKSNLKKKLNSPVSGTRGSKVELKSDLFDGPILSKHAAKDSQFSVGEMKPTARISDSFGAEELTRTRIDVADKPYPPKAVVHDSFVNLGKHYLRKRDLSQISLDKFPTVSGKKLKCKRRRSELSASAVAAEGLSTTSTPILLDDGMSSSAKLPSAPLLINTTTEAPPAPEPVDKAAFCRSRSDGFYRFPGNCSRILQCFDGEVLEYPPCPFNLAFDPEREICDYADNVKGCGSSLRVNRFDAAPFSSGECADHDHGDHVANQQDCSSFYRCVWGRAVLMKCPGGTYFNPTISVCDYPSQVPTCQR